MQLARAQVEVHSVERQHARKALGDALEVKDDLTAFRGRGSVRLRHLNVLRSRLVSGKRTAAMRAAAQVARSRARETGHSTV
jgi:hypothetical protein